MTSYSIVFDSYKMQIKKKKCNFNIKCTDVGIISVYEVGSFKCGKEPFVKTYETLSSEKELKLDGRITSWDSFKNKNGYIQYYYKKNNYRVFFVVNDVKWTLGQKEINIYSSIYKAYKNGKSIDIKDIPYCGKNCVIGIDSSAGCDALCDLYCTSPDGGYPTGCDCSCSAARFCCCSF